MSVLAISAAAGSVASSQVVPGVLGFLVVAALSVALFFLLRSMNKQLRKVTPPAKQGTAKKGAAGPAKADGRPRADQSGGVSGKP